MVLRAHTSDSETGFTRALRWKLGIALVVPALAWFAAQNAGYFFVPWACARTNGEWVLHGIAIGALVLCLTCGFVALAVLREVGVRGDDEQQDATQRARFQARIALGGAVLFALIVIVQWLAIGILDPCQPYPRSRFTPDANATPPNGAESYAVSTARVDLRAEVSSPTYTRDA